MSCPPFSQIPTPPTTSPSCAVPIGGSNSSLLDACCNTEVNPIFSYSASQTPQASPSSGPYSTMSISPPAAQSSSDNCFQYCITSDAEAVQSCLADKLSAYKNYGQESTFQCFNIGAQRKGGVRPDVASGAGATIDKGGKWVMGLVVGFGIVSVGLGGY